MSVYDEEPEHLRNPLAPPRQEPARPNDASKASATCTPLEKRLAPFPSMAALEEAMVMSSHKQELFTPRVVASCGTRAVMTMKATQAQTAGGQVVRNPVFELVDKAIVFDKQGTQQPISIRFKPTTVGRQEGLLECTIQWSDGQVQKRSVEMHGRAISSRDIPADQIDRRDDHEQDGKRAPDPGYADVRDLANEVNILDLKAGPAATHARAIAGAQRAAMIAVSENIKSFERRPPPSPLWMELAKVAVQLSAVGIGGMVASSFAPRLAGILGKVTKGASEHEDVIAGMTESLQEGFAMAADSVLGAGPSPVPGDGPAPGESNDYSSNPRIGFVGKQHGMLEQLSAANETIVHDKQKRLQHLLRRNPQAAYDTMDQLKKTFEDVREHAGAEQLRSAHTLWTSGVAQTSGLGAETLKDPVSGRDRRVTKLEAGENKDRAGLLRLAVDWDAGSDASSASIRVTSAAIDGISQEIADSLRDADLSKHPLPLRIRVTSGSRTGFITRDEAGRVQVTGEIPTGDAGNYEGAERYAPNMHRNGTRLCKRILQKTLTSWGVTKIHTNDATGRGD